MLNTNDNPHFLALNKDKPLLVLNAIVFQKNKEIETKKYWVCPTIGCDAYGHATVEDVVLKITGEYNHLPHPENVVLKSFRTNLKQRAMKETTPIIKVHEEVATSQMPPQTLAIISRKIFAFSFRICH